MQQTPGEAKALFKDLLIGVKSFFRGLEAFEILAHQGIEKMVQNKNNNELLGGGLFHLRGGIFFGDGAF
jgi:chemotaxis methyl-accepting protein methylase